MKENDYRAAMSMAIEQMESLLFTLNSIESMLYENGHNSASLTVWSMSNDIARAKREMKELSLIKFGGQHER